jgi:hypothetical protein
MTTKVSMDQILKSSFLLIVSIQIAMAQQNKCPAYAPTCGCPYSLAVLVCNNFTDFNQLKFSAINPNVEHYFQELELIPLVPLELDNSLSLSGLFIFKRVTLRKIKRFQLLANSFMGSVSPQSELYIYDSNMTFYINKTHLLDEKTCKLEDVLAAAAQFELAEVKPMFTSFESIIFDKNILYETPESSHWCPFVFANLKARQIRIEYLDYSKNFIRFIKVMNGEKPMPIGGLIKRLDIYNSNLMFLDESFLSKSAFANVEEIELEYCILKGIDETLFNSSFHALKSFSIELENLDEFMKNKTNKGWIKYLNGDVKVDLNNQLDILQKKSKQFLLTFYDRFQEDQRYDYPNEDLELYKDFPHNKLVFVRIFFNDEATLKCTETIKWLSKYWINYREPDVLLTQAVSSCLVSILTETTTPTMPSTTTLTSTTTKSDSYSFLMSNKSLNFKQFFLAFLSYFLALIMFNH